MEHLPDHQRVTAILHQRIDWLHNLDRIGASAFVVALWLTILFVLFRIWPSITIEPIRIILLIAGGLVLIFNTAAIYAMLRHYTDDKHFIYGLDIKHLDEMRKQRDQRGT